MMSKRRASRIVGVWFWSLAGMCAVSALYGLVAERGGFLLAGFLSGAWFTLLACLPRELFIEDVT